jgi:hypothetical protein
VLSHTRWCRVRLCARLGDVHNRAGAAAHAL